MPITQDITRELEKPDFRRRVAACRSLEDNLLNGEHDACTLLIEKLGDPHPAVRVTAAETLSTCPGDPIAAALLADLERLSENARKGHRASVIFALGLINRQEDERIINALLNETLSLDADCRFRAVTALNSMNVDNAVYRAALPTLLNDTDDEVAAVAAGAAADFRLDGLADQVVERWSNATGFAKRHLAFAAVYLRRGEEVQETLSKSLKMGEDVIACIDALVLVASDEAIITLKNAARGWGVHPVVRSRATVALCQLNITGSEHLLNLCLSHRKEILRHSTLEWMLQTEDAQFLPQLSEIINDPDHRDRVPLIELVEITHNSAARALLQRSP
jgi:HEAT repeat protein